MEALPLEIIIIIASFLPVDTLTHQRLLAPYATLSRKWQGAIERRTFSSLRLSNEFDDLDIFSDIVWPNYTRRMFLRHLTFRIYVRRYTGKGSLQRASEMITSNLQMLFFVLSKSDGSKEIALKLSFHVSASHSLDHIERQSLEPRFELIGRGEQLATVKCVSSLALYSDAYIGLALRTIVDLMARFPRLRSIRFTRGEYCTYRNDRHGLATALIDAAGFLSKTECLKVTLTTERVGPWPYYPRFSSYLTYNTSLPPYDTFGAAMRMWSHNLVYLKINGVLSSSIFWPSGNEQSEIKVSHWPRLRELYVAFAIMTPEGGWYFEEPSDIQTRRCVPCNDTLWPLFEAWAKAIESMPVLEQALVGFNMAGPSMFDDYYPYKWSIVLQVPDVLHSSLLGTWTKNLGPYLHNSRLIFQDTNG
ncbi:uncharacterized protein F4812DRAFT_469161 [Daldinia caldariorum]|uniref:uncharacterized protein n=1 Tax=Daldinia caldariorum TaxID=326644 RepID=UPI0020083007|nr:uncharacterized protein F4812DRAFT_469161 [Daldinia caldariorum]KAI1470596.1 hypothetical protein F4812DRAFT_469161 [Daldinia caldariorum]